MHELPAIQKILAIVLKSAEENDVKKVLSIELHIGALSDFEPVWMQKYFNQISKETIAENAKLNIDKEIPQMFCRSCGNYYKFDNKKNYLKCKKCSGQLEFIGSSDYIVKNIEVL